MMSGDLGLRVTAPAALQALSEFPQIFLHLVGDEAGLQSALGKWPADARGRSCLVHAPKHLPMGAKPTEALRADQATSMHIALQALSDGRVAGVVSAGNAGALMVLARQQIGMLRDSARPAFCSQFPTASGHSLLLDLGANVDCSAQMLCSFAQLGSALFSCLYGSEAPRVALLSNGVEAGKGSRQVRLAAEALAAMPTLNYTGYIEANGLHRGGADIIVCDGFVGNIALKAIEGTATLAGDKLAQLLSAGQRYGLSDEGLRQLRADFAGALDPEMHNGAFLLGLAGVVVKAHGHSSVEGFVASIGQALKCEQQHMIEKMKTRLALADDAGHR